MLASPSLKSNVNQGPGLLPFAGKAQAQTPPAKKSFKEKWTPTWARSPSKVPVTLTKVIRPMTDKQLSAAKKFNQVFSAASLKPIAKYGSIFAARNSTSWMFISTLRQLHRICCSGKKCVRE